MREMILSICLESRPPRPTWGHGPGSLTALSQTGGTAPDSGVHVGRPVDPDLWRRIPAHGPDTPLWSTDQKVGVFWASDDRQW